jgi:hypothetical protein
MKPHRGTLLLVLGILGLVCCAILAPITWVMANTDLREMQAGVMDRSGEQLTNVAKILGIIGTVLIAIGLLLFVLQIALGVALLPFAGGQM